MVIDNLSNQVEMNEQLLDPIIVAFESIAFPLLGSQAVVAWPSSVQQFSVSNH
jgi:hypothetical protein